MACSCQSEALGKSIASVLSHQPFHLDSICQRLYGRPLPPPLRQLVWKFRLIKVERSDTFKQVQTQLAEAQNQFENTITWGLKELGVSSAGHSPIEGVIKHAVLEAYQYRFGLQHELVTHQHIKLVIETLNVLYVHNRSYEPHYALLLFPMACAFGCDERDGHSLGKCSWQLLE